MSLFDVKNLINFSHPLPLSVWATLCAVVLLGILVRRAKLPPALEPHGGKIWSVLFVLPVALILSLFVFGIGERSPEPQRTTAADRKSASSAAGSAEPDFAQSRTATPPQVPTSPECLAAVVGKDGVDDSFGADGRPRLQARRSLIEPDASKRFNAYKIAEELAGADLVRYAQKGVVSERTTTSSGVATNFHEVVRSLATGTLSGVRTIMTCYVNDIAWVVLEVPIR
jgi:hypothetical protein